MATLKENNYYALFTDHSGLQGIPSDLDIKVFEKEVKGDAFGDDNRIYYEWMKPAFPDYTLNSEFYLYTKNAEEFRFDYYRYSSNFIVSDLFLSLLDKYAIPYTKGAVRIFDAADNKELEFQKRYFFVKFEFTEHAVDRELSVFEDALSDAGQPIVHKGVHYVHKYDHLVLNPANITHEAFVAKDIKLAFNVCCGDVFREEILAKSLYGIIIKPLSEFIDFAENHGELGQEVYQRNKSSTLRHAAAREAPAKPLISDETDIRFRILNRAEEEEILQLAANAEEMLLAESGEEGETVAKIAWYVDEQKIKKEIDQRKAFELGSLYGRLIVEKHGWEWRQHTAAGEAAYCVVSPDQHFACRVHHYLYALMRSDRTNNLKLLFNMMADLSEENRSGAVTFLN